MPARIIVMAKKNILSIGVAFIIMFIGFYILTFQKEANENSGTSDYVLTTTAQRDNYTNLKYQKQGYFGIKVSPLVSKKLNSNNYYQMDLIKHYNENNDINEKDINVSKQGICWAAAMTSLVRYYGCNTSEYDISKRVLDTARKGKYWYPNTDGVYDSEEDDILDAVFDSYGGKYKKYNANSDTFGLYNTVKKEVNAGRVSLLSVKDHTMTACGYEMYIVNYKYKNWLGRIKNKTASENYVVVNDTWANNKIRQYSYYPVDQISTSLFDRMNFTVTKVIK